MKTRHGFSLIELLTIMAIIAILAAIGMAIYPRAKEGANKRSDISKLNNLRNVVSLYREDQGGFPPAILGYATLYGSGPTSGVIPADQVANSLMKRMNLLDMQTAESRHQRLDTITLATWSAKSPTPIGSDPRTDLDGNGSLDASDDAGNTRQAWDMFDGCITREPAVIDQHCTLETGSVPFYAMSGFDVARSKYVHPHSDINSPCYNGQPYPSYERRYALFWSKLGIGVNVVNNEGLTDDPNQLGYNNPPDSTIVTWNSDYRNYESGVDVNCVSVRPQAGSLDWVLTVSGAARPVASRRMFVHGWRGYR